MGPVWFYTHWHKIMVNCFIFAEKKMCISGNAKSMKKNAYFYAKSKIEFTFISSKIFYD